MIVRLLQSSMSFAVKLPEDVSTLTIASDPEPVISHVVDDANLKLFESGETYTFYGEEEAFHDQEIDDCPGGKGPWHLVVVNESAVPVAIGIEELEEEDEDQDESEEDEEEDEEEEEAAPESAK